MIWSKKMDRVITLTSFEQDEVGNAALKYWLTRPAEERLEEVERLRREYIVFAKRGSNDIPERLSRSLLVLERD